MAKPNIKISDFSDLLKSAGYYTRSQIELYNKFSRFGYYNQYTTLVNTREYIFFTKPDLHLFESGNTTKLNTEIASDPFFVDMLERYNDVMKQLQISNKENRSPFINLLCNTVRSKLDMPTISSTDVEGPSNIYGDDIPYRWTSDQSDNNHEFSLDFEDSKYLEVYMFFKIYDEYQRKKSKGIISPPDKNYIFNKILHDQFSAYKIIVGEDGETIIFFAKLWGVYPKKVPREAFSDLSDGEKLKFSVDFNATFIEDSNPTILSEFNILCRRYNSGSTLPIYNTQKKMIDGDWASMPYIITSTNNAEGRKVYKLKWRK